MDYIEPIGDGHLARPLTEADKDRDDLGFTNPNLHRRIYVKGIIDPEVTERDYQLRIQGIYSYRTTFYEYYNEIIDLDEIP